MVGNLIEPEKILASKEILEKIEAVCKRHFSNENDQNESYVFILDCLKADNFKRLRAYKGKSKLTTYLYSLINSLIVDFRRKIYGRRRIPAGVAKLGPWAEAVYRLVCWQKFSFDDAYDFLQVEGLFEEPYERYLEKIVPIREAPCRENPSYEALNEDVANPMENANRFDANPLEALLGKLDHQRRIKALTIIKATTTKLSEEDQLLIRLVYGSEQSVKAAATVIGLSASSARRRLKRLLIRFREQLLAEGIREA
ncbi:MAG: sigma-70 family RNA polymerase sigma factor [Desulfobacterales bacterium]|nr:sigma-70 family RNA polymerase sigma factor [Desulfobacterales bacterium]